MGEGIKQRPATTLVISSKLRPVYVSFVNKAILWDRGLCHFTAQARPVCRPLLCPRFLSHMKARPEDFRPPCFLSTKSRVQPPPQGKTLHTHILAAPKTQAPEGSFRLSPDRRRSAVQNERRRSAVVVPCPLLPAAPPPSTINPTPPHHNTLPLHSGRKEINPSTVPASPSLSHPAPQEEDESQEREKAARAAAASVITEPHRELLLHPGAAGLEHPASPTSLSQGSLSDLSRPPSSLFSRSTDLTSGRSSILSADIRDWDSEGGGCFRPPQPSPVVQLPLASHPPAGSNPHRSPTIASANPPLYEPLFGRTKPLSSRSASGLHPDSDKPLSRSTKASEHLHPGRCGTAASRYSELSCSRSHVFDELEAIAPRSTSCPSQDPASDSSGCPSPDTELSPGLAALTVGCDSGNLGSLSRVQLLLLDRPEPETLESPCDPEEELSSEQDWINLRMQYDPRLTSEGVVRPLTAGSISERCDSAGKVRENKSHQSDGGSGSPSSWIIDQSPSYDMFRSSYSPCPSNHSSSTDEGGPTEEEPNYPGQRGQVESWHGGRSPESLERRMDEKKTKVLNMLSKLQDDTPRKKGSSKGCSNFEDFEFLAKYCIFSQEKLDEYKRAFQAEDSDGDGYISCLQVLLALKNIIPPELLSDEEEIYVYRILEMVDFRVTDGLVDLRLFAVIASLAQKIAAMDEFMRSLVSSMDFRSLEVRVFKAKQLFLFLLEEQRGDAGAQQGFISAEQLLLELKAGGIHVEQEAAIRLELQHIPPLDLLDFLAYLPLFMLIHKSVISNPFNDSGTSATAQSAP
ncbi:uncharacterized protein LOC130163822 isoform X4 [Seriola aureovittata]|uniref:uncharacterized protein LOC130163822 isoform X4 n=1 Tax=Seriola aureovittata TaxID=2871759 RepID=UPI0024BEE8A3|nr:uncharacterized protein LOC130163822 isoform X4 [Seriola aureovittata]